MKEKSDRRIIFIRCVLWYGIIADFLFVIQYCFPELMTGSLGIVTAISPFTRFILIQAAILMAAWTVLLIWVDRKPIERRMVMLLTVPIAITIAGSFYYLIASDVISPLWSLFLIAPLATAGLFLASYILANRVNRSLIQ